MGLFIVVEGQDGSGKGYYIKELQQTLFESRTCTDVYLTREPWRTLEGHMALSEIHGKNSNEDFLLSLFCTDREAHCELIREILPSVDFVVCDRYFISTLVHQHPRDKPVTTKFIENHLKKIIRPDLVILLETPDEVVLERLKKRKDLSKYEHEALKVKGLSIRYEEEARWASKRLKFPVLSSVGIEMIKSDAEYIKNKLVR